MRRLSVFHHVRNDPFQEMLVYESKNIVFCRFARFLYQIAFPHNPTPPPSSGDARYSSLAPYRVLEIYS